MKTKILLDSTSDIPHDWLDKLDVTLIPLHLTWPDGVQEDDDSRDISDIKDFWNRLEKSDKLPTSSQPSPGEIRNFYEKALKEGYEEILVLCISTNMSGTYNTAKLVAEEFDIPIYVVDTKNASSINALAAKRARELLNEGKSVEEVGKIIEKEIAEEKFQAIFYVSRFDYLVKGGRVSKFQGFVGNLLSINVGLYIEHNTGAMIPFKKVRGEKKARTMLINKALEEVPEGSTVDIILVHADNEDSLASLRKLLEATYNVREITTSFMGKVISTHVGPGTAGFALYKVK
ncbi:DegV family protein [Kosmotoga pacifica]|uniref:Carbohydrate-binding protein n=1 Tax=Kosmotoga pacifica TaxID=1330330 RepID=A0A0G2ZBK2_9BACT|nr:DegV family protein [Kosmotoga pacifica]AKI97446.1 carbohydrate-binding protein [Kosmotoga pacifica]